MATTLKIGDRAPEFELLAPGGRTVRLGDYRGRTLVLYFYPRDETPVCTREACAFRDSYEDFTAAGAEVIGVSVDTVDAHRRFAEHHRLPFTLVSDPGNRVGDTYGVRATLGLLPGRVTFMIDGEGVVRHSFSSPIRYAAHVAEALAVVRALEARRPVG